MKESFTKRLERLEEKFVPQAICELFVLKEGETVEQVFLQRFGEETPKFPKGSLILTISPSYKNKLILPEKV